MNLNSSPYYDDFVAEKKFSQILFKPGFAVQARELTQLQTLLQAQIQRFGDNIFAQGSVITGCAESHNFNTPFVKVLDIAGNLTDYVGQTITAPSGIAAVIKTVAVGSVALRPNLNTLYVQYTSNNTIPVTVGPITYAPGTLSNFQDGDVLAVAGANIFTVDTNGTGYGSLFALSDGIVYADGFFVLHSNQTVVIDRYGSAPTQNVGYVLSKTIVTSDDDASLLDPASGSYNYSAPGADRLAVSTILTSYDPSTPAPDGFVLLFEVVNGLITRRYDKTQYAELGIELAQRTYDEAGDYTVRNFPLLVSEHLNNGVNHGIFSTGGDLSKLVIGVQPGKAYVRGYEQELYSTQNLVVDKGIDTQTAHSEYVSTNYGNYVLVDEVAGPWSLNTGETVQLHSTAVHAITGGGFSGTVAPGAQIGTAQIRNVVFDPSTANRPGTALAQYRIYLSNVVMTGGAFSAVKSLYLPDAVHSYADTVLPAALVETQFTSFIFPLTKDNAKSLSSDSFVSTKQYSATVSGSGTFSISTSGLDEWAFSSPSNSAIDANIIAIADTAFSGGTLGTIAKGKYFNLTAANITSMTTNTINFSLGGSTSGTPSVVVIANVRSIDSYNTKTLIPNVYVKIDTATNVGAGTSTNPYLLGVHDVFSIDKVWVSVAAGPQPGLATYDLMVADAATNGGAGTHWQDVTNQFFLVSGATDSQYGIDGIASNTAYPTKSIIVKFSWLQHASSTGYYSVQSYPLPAENVAPTSTQINWWQIPKYTASSGVTYSLQNCLDFRTTVSPASGAGTVLTPDLATLNPTITTTYQSPITTPTATGVFITDITYHLARIDRVVLDSSGTFLAVRGTASNMPVAPKQPDNAMTLGYVNIPAYPSLSPYYARIVSRPEYATSVVQTDNRRFTMKDIGTLQSRLDRLEYETSLSALEQSASDLQILNPSGINRHKNGILVDSFIGHNVGNVYDPAYSCSIADGILRPSIKIDNVGFDIDASSINVVQNANDAIIVVSQLLNAPIIAEGSTLIGSAGGTGIVAHNVPIISNSTSRWVRLYLNEVSGTFSAGNTVNGAIGTITYSGLSLGTLSATLRPDLIVTPQGGTHADGSTYVSSVGPLATLPYTHQQYAQNTHVTQTRSCASDVLFTFEGTVHLAPEIDMWPDTHVHAEVQVNTNNFFDNWKTLSDAWKTQWNAWRTLWYGKIPDTNVPTDPTLLGTALTADQRQAQDGISLVSKIDVTGNVIPFIRSSIINFTAFRLKANTTLHAFFDGVDVSAQCKNTTDTSFGVAPLITDSTGHLSGQFRIPAETFTVGTKSFVLTDNTTDPQSTNLTTVAVGTFTANGAVQYDNRSILSTRTANTTIASQRQTQNLVVSRQVSTSDITDTADPLSQTFFISNNDDGVLLTKIDVYFQQKSLVSSVTLQLREVVNGYPTDTIIPFGSITLQPQNVNTSTDGSAPTEFKFLSPVYLKNNTEYCFSILPTGNDTNYVVWSSVLGDVDIGTSIVADKSANVGSVFAVNNNRAWVELTNESLTFTLYTAAFDPTIQGTLVLSNHAVDYMALTPSNPLITFNVGDSITGLSSGSTGVGVIKYVHPVSNSNRSAAQVAITSGNFLAADSFSNGTITTETRIVNAIAPALSHLSFNNSPVNWFYQLYQSNGTPFTEFASLDITGTTELTTEQAVFSHSTQPTTFQIKGILATKSENISPIIDIEKCSCAIIANNIDNLNSMTNNENTNSGIALSKYISRTVTLNDGEDAEDLRVYFSASLPANSSVQVWAKVENVSDQQPFATRSWFPMTQKSIQNIGTFTDYYFTLTAADAPISTFSYLGVGGVLYEGFRTFAIKIVFSSPSTTAIPLIKDLRAIALLI